MKGVKTHGSTNQFDTLARATDQGESQSHLRKTIRIIGVERVAPLEMRQRQVELIAIQMDYGEELTAASIFRVQSKCRLSNIKCFFLDRAGCIGIAMLDHQGQSKIGMR